MDSVLLDEIITTAGIPPSSDNVSSARVGVHALLAALLTPQHAHHPLDESLIALLIADIDRRLSQQLDEILHHGRFQQLESRWRGLRFLVDRVNFRENTRVEILNCSKEDLLMDFEDAPEIPKSGLYKIVYSAEYGPFGGRPFAVIAADWDFHASEADMYLLEQCAAVASQACLAFIAAAHPSLLGGRTAYTAGAHGPGALSGSIGGRWHAFRHSAPARFVGLVFPRTLARRPHQLDPQQPGVRNGFRYAECIANPRQRAWQSSVYALSAGIARSFAQWRLCANISGTECGRVEDAATWVGPGSWPHPSTVEVALSEEREQQFIDAGFIPLGVDAATGEARFGSAPSCLAANGAHPERLEEADRALHRQLPSLFLITRFVQYLKVLQREQIGSWRELPDLQRELSRFVAGWVDSSAADSAAAAAPLGSGYHSRTTHPLRQAHLDISQPPEQHSSYRLSLHIQPNWRYDGRFFNVVLEDKLDRE